MVELIVLRHGESKWNLENRFTGWTNISLSEKGIKEATNAGLLLKSKGFKFDLAYTSALSRAQETLNIILEKLDIKIPILKSEKLNERHYGALQGQNKKEAALKFGEEQVKIWRRSYDTKPPKAEVDPVGEPNGESLKDTYNRVIPFYLENIENNIKQKKKVLIVAHGNSLRALSKYLLNISDDEIIKFEIPTGKPLKFVFDDDFKVVSYAY